MRVAVVVNCLKIGGMERVAVNLADAFSKAGHESHHSDNKHHEGINNHDGENDDIIADHHGHAPSNRTQTEPEKEKGKSKVAVGFGIAIAVIIGIGLIIYVCIRVIRKRNKYSPIGEQTYNSNSPDQPLAGGFK